MTRIGGPGRAAPPDPIGDAVGEKLRSVLGGGWFTGA